MGPNAGLNQIVLQTLKSSQTGFLPGKAVCILCCSVLRFGYREAEAGVIQRRLSLRNAAIPATDEVRMRLGHADVSQFPTGS